MASASLVARNQRVEEGRLCFASDSTLDLHRHPRVVESVRRVLAEARPSRSRWQPRGGADRWLRQLEEVVSAFHGREDTIVLSNGQTADWGVVTAFLRPGDLVACDRFSEGALDEVCRRSSMRRLFYAHLDLAELDRALGDETVSDAACLVVSDGVFPLHGHVAPLPGLHAIAKRHGAKLAVSEAYALGVYGETGRGLEEHFALPGAIDVLVGSFGTAAGAFGGYVSGRAELIARLRRTLRPCLPSLPSPVCAGVIEAFRLMQSEPEHRLRLWQNARHLWCRLDGAGLMVPPRPAPILPLFVGDEHLLGRLDRELQAAGIVCGSVRYPAVRRGEAILRLAVNASHTAEELDCVADALVELARRFDVLRRSRPQTRETPARASSVPMRTRV